MRNKEWPIPEAPVRDWFLDKMYSTKTIKYRSIKLINGDYKVITINLN